MLPDLVIDINCYSHVKMAQQRVKTVSAFIRREIGVSTSIWNYKTRCYWDKVDSFLISHKERMGGTDILLRTGDEHPEHTPHAQDRCWESMRTQQAARRFTFSIYPTNILKRCIRLGGACL